MERRTLNSRNKRQILCGLPFLSCLLFDWLECRLNRPAALQTALLREKVGGIGGKLILRCGNLSQIKIENAYIVIPAKVGIRKFNVMSIYQKRLKSNGPDSRLRGDDEILGFCFRFGFLRG
ncbi:TPA: hypothetical protein ACFNM3_000497 [Neisseria lactamica]|uniref:hypothetical protein n=1 Tax=Neisseria lactamica TaxID=486 RepID=UPI0027E01EDB|nr:hypothetical protein [Neisseria lactamica]